MSGKLRPAELLAGSGAIILFASTFLVWFSLPSAQELLQLAPNAKLAGGGSGNVTIDLNVWDLGWARVWIYLAIFLGFSMVLAALLSRTAEWSIILCTPLVVVSLAAFICLFVRLFDSPRPYAETQVGFYIALVGCGMLLAGTLWAIRDDSVPEGFDKAPRPEFIQVD